MPRWVVKLLALFGTFLLPLICTLLPYKVSGYIANKGASGKLLLSYLMCLGGGIFFGTYLLHMGPEVQTILKEALLDPYEITYPVVELIVGVGFFIVLFSEKLVLRWNKRRLRRKHSQSHHRPSISPMSSIYVNGAESNHVKCQHLLSGEMGPDCKDGKQCHGGGEKMNGHDEVVAGQEEQQNAIDNNKLQSAQADASSHLLTQSAAADDVFDHPASATASDCLTSGTSEHCPDAAKQQHQAFQKDRQTMAKMNVEDPDIELHSGGHHHATRSLVLILALSLHRIFEGMSIGLQQTVASVASLFGAVMCHETVIGFSLGLQFLRSGFALRRLLITSFVCSVIMPLGVLIGLVMTEIESTDSNVDIANGILQAVAMGTFIYVTFFEILQEEIDAADTSLGKIVCIAAGFALMALLNLVPEGPIVTSNPRHMTTAGTVAPSLNATLMA